MSEVNEREALAKALYLEARDARYTYQVIIAPDAVSADKTKIYQAMGVHRRVSHWSPRKNWKFSGWGYARSQNPARTPMGDFEQLGKDELETLVGERMQSLLAESVSVLSRRGFSMPKPPFVVEMSEKDYKSFSEQKMSPDLYRRIFRSRGEFGYDPEIYPTPEPAPAPATT